MTTPPSDTCPDGGVLTFGDMEFSGRLDQFRGKSEHILLFSRETSAC